MVKRCLPKVPMRKKQTTVLSLRERTLPSLLKETPKGLAVYHEIFSKEIMETIVSNFDQNPWDCRFAKKMQHYGYFFNHAKNRLEVSKSMQENLMPSFQNYLSQLDLPSFNMCSVEEYLPNNFRNYSIESLRYGQTIVIINLGSPVTFDFRRRGYENYSVVLGNSSLMVLMDESRTFWQHKIESGDLQDSNYRRIQLTFRQVPGDQI